jgi:phosphatidylinositol-4,5-bisphosphate 3-kinase
LISKRQNDFPIVFNLTVDPKAIIKEFRYAKLRVFNSKKVPMMLTMVNAQPGGNDLICMFKNGDDLRQDILTLQIISVMDKIWLREKLDLKMTPYKVIGTDCMQGYLEFVDDCETLAKMQYENPEDGTKSIWETYNDYKVQIWMEYKAMERMVKKVTAELADEQFHDQEEYK